MRRMIPDTASRCPVTKPKPMNFFLKIVLSAAIAGLLAAVLLTAMQTTRVFPLIAAAEQYEGEAPTAPAHDHKHDAKGHHHHHDGDAWAPEDGAERLLFSFISNALIGVAFALVLAAIFAVRGVENWRQGLLWGVGGFVAVQLAPALGLPPELPGMPAGDLMARQLWWVGTVAATAAGLAALFLGQQIWARALGVVLLAGPHIVGAPHPADKSSAVPANLAAEFVSASLATNLVFWAALGLLCAYVLKQFGGDDTPEAA